MDVKRIDELNEEAMDQLDEIITTLLKLRKKAGISQEALSAATNISRGTLSKLESFNGIPDFKTIAVLLSYYGARLEVVLPPKNKGQATTIIKQE